MSTVDLLSVNHDQLSSVAVFLEQIYQDEHELEMKSKLEDVFVAHLSQMCEIQRGFAGLGLLQSLPVADRSIMPVKIRRPKNNFKRYIRDMIIMLKYRELLSFFLILYNGKIEKNQTGGKWTRGKRREKSKKWKVSKRYKTISV